MTEWADQERHYVYVALLDQKVTANKHFQKQNPEFDGKNDCYYVGCTGKTPKERFAEHKAGYKAGRGIVRDYGLYLVPAWTEKYGAMTQEKALKLEEEEAERLRKKGYGAYQN